jgi:GT2 family glycosyltransferase
MTEPAIIGPVPTVEALIVSYNTRDILRDCLRSLQAWPPAGATLGVAVLDNGSADGSADMVAAEFPDVRLVRSAANLGFGKANNRLARTSEADYVLLLNSDTVLVEDLVAPLLAELRSDPARAIAGPRLEFPDGRVQYSSQAFPRMGYEVARALRGSRVERALRPVVSLRGEIARVQEEGRVDERATRPTDFLWATCWLIGRDDVRATGLFDEDFPIYDEDLDLCRRLRAVGRDIVYVPSVRLVHLGGRSSGSPGAKNLLEEAARERYYATHHGRLAKGLYLALRRAVRQPLVRRVARLTAPGSASPSRTRTPA